MESNYIILIVIAGIIYTIAVSITFYSLGYHSARSQLLHGITDGNTLKEIYEYIDSTCDVMKDKLIKYFVNVIPKSEDK